MSKVKPSTKEQLIYFLLQNISLGTYDKRFLSNLQNLNILVNKPVTTNQSDLLDKIVIRYHRQLAKKEINSKEMVNLSWNIKPIESSPQYTQAFISIEDDKILLRTPYKKEYVKKIKELSYMSWNKDTKTWSGNIAEFILRDLLHLTAFHFTDINYCENVKQIVDNICVYEDSKYWEPTLVRRNGIYYIFATNEFVTEQLKNFELDLDLITLAKLSSLSIKIDSNLIDEIEKVYDKKDVEFAVNNNITLDQTDIDDVIRKINTIQPDFVMLVEWFSTSTTLTEKLYKELTDSNIKTEIYKFRSFENHEFKNSKIEQYKFPILINVGLVRYRPIPSSFFAKQIFLANNTHIKITVNERM